LFISEHITRSVWERETPQGASARAAIATHQPWYDPDHPDFCAPFKDKPFIVCPRYADLCSSVSVSGQYADVLSIMALSYITGPRIQMFFPWLTGAFDAHPLTQCILGHGVYETARSLTSYGRLYPTLKRFPLQ